LPSRSHASPLNVRSSRDPALVSDFLDDAIHLRHDGPALRPCANSFLLFGGSLPRSPSSDSWRRSSAHHAIERAGELRGRPFVGRWRYGKPRPAGVRGSRATSASSRPRSVRQFRERLRWPIPPMPIVSRHLPLVPARLAQSC
jgi:hypothetical protein